MPNFDIANQNKVHKSVLRQIGHDRFKAALANVTRDQLAQIATDIRRKNDKRNAKGLASQYFGPKQSPNGKFIMSYPKPLGKMMYLDHAAAAKDETVFWKLLRAAVKARDAEAKVAAAATKVCEPILTVNVIKLENGLPSDVTSWPESPEGNKAAEEYFSRIAKEMGCPEDDLSDVLDDGYYGNGNPHMLTITHSSGE
jgi:hypothetical protein